MPASLHPRLKESRPVSRIFLWTLLVVFNAFLWVLLLLFHFEISLRAREVRYFGTQLFPVQAPRGVSIPVVYAACALLTIASAAAIRRDRNNMNARERIRTLLLQILASIEIGVIVLDDTRQLAMANESAHRLLPEIPSGYVNLDIWEVLQNRPRLREIVNAATHHRSYTQEVEHDLGTPEEPRPVRITTLPLLDPQKRTTGTLLLVRDVKEAVRRDRQMRIAERLSALGTLAAAMAHEIRNPLEALDLNLALLERSMRRTAEPEREGFEKHLKILESEVARLASIVEDFLSFARPSQSQTEAIHLESILRQIVDLLSNQARSCKVDIDLSVSGDPIVVGAEDQLKQAFLNLMINSLEAMPDGGNLRVSAETSLHAGTAGDLVVVRIRDTGVGIPQEQISRLFDPFYTTRSKGTGLGLTIVHRVIREHKGHIHVTSSPGQGAVFTIELPLAAAAAGAHGVIKTLREV